VEIKAKAALEDVDVVQTISYLKASGYQVALLLNFGGPVVEIRRLGNTRGSTFLNREGKVKTGNSGFPASPDSSSPRFRAMRRDSRD
jgi:hypothetical protein